MRREARSRKPAGRTDDDVCAAAKGVFLRPVADAAVESDDAHAAELSQDLDLAGDLLAKLPRGYDDEGERRSGASLDALEDREREGAGLAGAGLRLREEIAACA